MRVTFAFPSHRRAEKPIHDVDVFKENPSTVKIHPLCLLELRVSLLDKSGDEEGVKEGIELILTT